MKSKRLFPTSMFVKKWYICECHVGADCWCRAISTKENDKHFYRTNVVVGPGYLHKEIAEYLVELHNRTVKE